MNFSLIVATDQEWGIGKDGVMPWDLPGELKHFQDVTIGDGNNAVIMGRVTWQSIPEAHRPLKGRKNIVLTRNPEYEVPPNVEVQGSLSEALESAKDFDEVFVIGGGRVYHEAIQLEECEKIYRTVIEEDFDCDTFFPKIYKDCYELTDQGESRSENGVNYKFLTYNKIKNG